MLKLRNAVLTALLAFCLAMPFVSCSFNDGATGDVSNLVKEQPGNNQNGGNGGSTGGNEKPSGEDEDHDHDNNGGSGNPSGGDNGGSGNEKPGEGTTYVVKYNGNIIEKSLPEWMWSYGVKKVNLKEGVDYTMNGNEITLTPTGYEKARPLFKDSGEDGEHGGIPPVTDVPVPDVPVPDVPGVEGTVYTVMYSGEEIATITASELSHFETVLTKDTDYTISGNVITLTDSGLKKVMAYMPGEGGGQEVNPPVPDVPGDVEGTMYTVMYNGAKFATIPASELSHFETVLTKDTDYTISENVITLTDSGFKKLSAAGSGAGE